MASADEGSPEHWGGTMMDIAGGAGQERGGGRCTSTLTCIDACLLGGEDGGTADVPFALSFFRCFLGEFLWATVDSLLLLGTR